MSTSFSYPPTRTGFGWRSARLIGEHFTNIASATTTRYFVTDHLGSVAVITDETGTVVERLSYDAWGKRRFPTGADDPAGSISSQTTKGFTGHEMIDEVVRRSKRSTGAFCQPRG
jgi:hypothetical protein